MGELIPIDKTFNKDVPQQRELDNLIRNAVPLIRELPSISDQRRLLAIYLQYTEVQANFIVSDQDLDTLGGVIKEIKKQFLHLGIDEDGIRELIEEQNKDTREKFAINV